MNIAELPSIGAHKPFEQAAKALHQDWTPEKVHILIDVVDSYIAALASQASKGAGMVEGQCSPHPEAPHGFDRTLSHSLGRYVCECENWEEPAAPSPALAQPVADAAPVIVPFGNTDAAFAKGRAAGIEEAAKVAEALGRPVGAGDGDTYIPGNSADAARAIRALAKKEIQTKGDENEQ
jgi:hypothetical protein